MKQKETIGQVSTENNAHRIITEWKKRRAQDEKEAVEKLNSPEYEEVFKKLAEQNEQRKKRLSAR